MNDSFSLLAKSIRQNKINKLELLNNLKQISEAQSQKDNYIKKVIILQKYIRGILFRKKYSLLLDEINIKTVIDYLYEKKKKRIHDHSEEIISFFVKKYINKRKKKKSILYEQYKIHCANLIKARFKGILVRQKIKKNFGIKNGFQKLDDETKNESEKKMKLISDEKNKNGNYVWNNENDENGQNQYYVSNNKKNNYDYNQINSSKRLNHNYNLNSLKITPNNLSENLQKYDNENNKNIHGFNFEENKLENYYSNSNYNAKKNRYSLNEITNKMQNGINSNRDKNRFVSDKNVKKKFMREESSYLKMQIIDIDLNNIGGNKLFYSSKNINGFNPNGEICDKEINNYNQNEEREIKPLKTKDILNCKNPFGIRGSTYKKSNTLKESPKKIFDTQNFLGNSSKIINRDEKPIGGNKINYNELFGQDGEIKFEGDPFGGARQFETNKDKINSIKKASNKKKPIYDARKAIEEAKLKEEKNGKDKEKDNKNKHNQFREFLKEMKKININKDKENNKNSIEKDINIMKRNSENIPYLIKDKINGINIYDDKNIINDDNNKLEFEERKNSEISQKNIPQVNKKISKREKSINKSSNQLLRQKLHELEKTPAPALNKRGIKSKVKCWFNKESPRNKNKKDEEDKEKENYIEKILIQINLELNKINGIFNIDNYFDQKEIKMKKYSNIPYIKKNDEYGKNIDMNDYENLLNEISKEYKILK